MDKLEECQHYIAQWYLGNPILAVRMDGNPMDDLCIQYMVVELLRDLIDHPFPSHFKPGSTELATWMTNAYHTVAKGHDFGFQEIHIAAVINLAFNYFIDGIVKVQWYAEKEGRVYKCWRGMYEKKH